MKQGMARTHVSTRMLEQSGGPVLVRELEVSHLTLSREASSSQSQQT